MQEKRKGRFRLFASVILACVAFVLLSFPLSISAKGIDTAEIPHALEERTAVSTVEPALSSVPTKKVSDYVSYPITLWGKAIGGRALLINGTIYIPMRSFSEAAGAKVSYNSAERTLTVSLDGLYLTVSDGAYVTYVNDRAFFTGESAVIMNDGRMYMPISTAMKAFGLSYRHTTAGIIVSGNVTPPLHASKFYRDDEVLWLSRIISAESKGEPLLGQIAVGSVVLNRVKSEFYPGTIYSVIFDRKYGVQFSPILDGSIYATPSYSSTLAAKICLEGIRVGEDALFFLRPEASSSLWIPTTRKFLLSIGNHDFYA